MFAKRGPCAHSARRTRNPYSTLGRVKFRVGAVYSHVPGWSTLGDQTGPVDIRGARPLHSGCCEAVLECASHAVDSRIFGSKPPLPSKKRCKVSNLPLVIRKTGKVAKIPPVYRNHDRIPPKFPPSIPDGAGNADLKNSKKYRLYLETTI